MKLLGVSPGSLEESSVAGMRATFPGTPNREFPGETSNLKNYNFLEASKYNLLSKCSTHGYYMLAKGCILRPPNSGSF